MQAPGHVQQGSGEGSREGSAEGLGGFGAEPGHVQQGCREGSRKSWWKAKSGSTGFRRRFRGGFGAEPGHRVPEKVLDSREGSGEQEVLEKV